MKLVDAEHLKYFLSGRCIRFGNYDEWEKCCDAIDDASIEIWGDANMVNCAASYIMLLHKEFGVSLKEAEKAHKAAHEYLMKQARLKG